MNSSAVSVLRSISMFSSLNPDDLEGVASASEFVDFAEGDEIFRAGDESDCLYVVVTGTVLIRTGDFGQFTDIARFLTGEVFGELDLFAREKRTADALSVGSTRLLKFPNRNLSVADLAETDPALSARLMRAFLIHVSARIRTSNALVKENSPLVKELRRQSYVDELTGLSNKARFEENLARILATEQNTGLLMYKPDNFKDINDAFGHEAGDKVLKYIADALQEFVPDRDMLFRYMGNENAVILPGADRKNLRNLAGDVFEFLRHLDLAPLLKGSQMRLSISVGLALSPEHGTSVDSLVDIAHRLALEGRHRGGDLILFPEDMNTP